MFNFKFLILRLIALCPLSEIGSTVFNSRFPWPWYWPVVTGTIDLLINGSSIAAVVILRVTHREESRLFKVGSLP